MKDSAIEEVFRNASLYPNETNSSFGKQYYDHPAILPGEYTCALHNSYDRGGPEYDYFYWLLARADHDDLGEVRNDWAFSEKPEFRDIIEAAMLNVRPSGARHQDRLKRAKVVREVFAKITGTSQKTPGGPADIMASYLVDDDGVEEVRGMENPMSFTADSSKAQRFRNAIRRSDLYTAKRIFDRDDDGQKKYYGEYLISLGSEALIGMINVAEGEHKAWLLGIILLYAERELLCQVLESVQLADEDLECLGYNLDLTCKIDKFIYFLTGISDIYSSGTLVGFAVRALFEANKTESFDSLLRALEDETSLDQMLQYCAIRATVMFASPFTDDNRMSYVQRFHDHPEVHAGAYSDALYRSYKGERYKNALFHLLLDKADLEDLQQARDAPNFPKRSVEFQTLIIDALNTLNLDNETRHERWYNRRRVAIGEALLEDDTLEMP